jgi:uncharacterized glyoxalase superfamily protein PhnB
MFTKFGIHIKVKDINASKNFYLALGFKPVFCYGNENIRREFTNIPNVSEKYNGIVFEIGSSLLEIADGHLAVKPDVFKREIQSSKISAMMDVNSIEELLAVCKNESIEISVPPKDFPWGTREVVIKDPDGFVLVFIEKIGAQ